MHNDRSGHHNHHHDHHDHEHHNCHGHNHAQMEKQSLKALFIALVLNASFVGIEVIGAMWTDSVAILADAVHDTGDTLVILLGIILVWLARQPADGKFTFGYKRLSLFGALITGLILIVGSVFILVESIQRFYLPHQPLPAGMFILSLLGIITNAVAFSRLHGGRSLTERAMKLHLLEDVFGWVGVLVVAIALWINPSLTFLDPLLSIIISSYIMYKASANVWPILKLLLQASPENIAEEDIISQVKEMPLVVDVHDVHIWSLDGVSHLMTFHLIVQPEISLQDAMEVKEKAREIVRQNGIWHSTIELEPQGAECDFEQLHK